MLLLKMNYTFLDDAFNFNTTIPRETTITKPRFSLSCIYCKQTNSIPLISDGTFRRCLNTSCRKEFQAQMDPPQNKSQISFLEQKHPNEYHMMNPELLKQQPRTNETIPMTIQQTQQVQFSHPDYDRQIRYKPL